MAAPTLTHALQAGSPAINRGDPAAPPQDQRGYGRAGVPDVGAFEHGGVAPTTLGNISSRAFVQTGDNAMIGGVHCAREWPKESDYSRDWPRAYPIWRSQRAR